LRIWIEMGIDPSTSMRQSIVHATARVAVAFVWIYQGLVPKVLFQHPTEIAMICQAGVPLHVARRLCAGLGWVEISVGICLIFCWKSNWPLILTLVAMPLALIAVAATSSAVLASAFNPVTLNVAVFALATIAQLDSKNLPSATRCARQTSERDE